MNTTLLSLERFSRQLLLPGWTLQKQRRIESLTAAVDSRWGFAALYLAGAGVVHHELTTGEGFQVWRRRILHLAPDAKVDSLNSDTLVGGLVLRSGDGPPLLTLRVGEPVAISGNDNHQRIEIEQLAEDQKYLSLEIPLIKGSRSVLTDLFLGAALATIALRWLVYDES